MKSTIPDGRPEGEAGNRTSTALLGLRLGLSLATIEAKMYLASSIQICTSQSQTFVIEEHIFSSSFVEDRLKLFLLVLL